MKWIFSKKEEVQNIKEVQIQLLNGNVQFLSEGFDINSFDDHGNNILHYYVKNSEHISIESNALLTLFLNKGIDINSLQSKSQKRSALHLAVIFKKRELVELLLKFNAKVDIVDENGNTPLWQAVMGYRNDDPFYIQCLVANGANVNIENKHGVSPLSLSNTIANYDSKPLLNPKNCDTKNA